MKKLLLVFVSLAATIMLASCGGGAGEPSATPVPELDPSQFLTVEDVAAAVDYQPVLDAGMVARDANVSTALYRSEPVGMGDPVSITVTQYNNEDVSVEDVWFAYDNDKVKRPSAEEVTELGENAYIAYPSINIYDRGCYIKITAGSGDDDNQKNLLLSLARVAVSRFEEIMPPPDLKSIGVEQK